MKRVQGPVCLGAPGQSRPRERSVAEILTFTRTVPAAHDSLARLPLTGNTAKTAHRNDPESTQTFDKLMMEFKRKFEVVPD